MYFSSGHLGGGTEMHRLLVVEDSYEVFELIKRSLGTAYRIYWVKTVGEASRCLDSKQFDLILLDVILPDGDGFKLCSVLRANDEFAQTPIVFLTAKNTVTDKVFGFSVGGDDFITKPFDGTELKVRVDAKIRRRMQDLERSQVLRAGDLEINKDTQKVSIHETSLDAVKTTEVDLTPLEFKLLFLLARQPNKVISRDMILQTIWGEDIHVYSRSVDTHVSKLRKKLGPRSNYINSIHGSGYQFVLPERKEGLLAFPPH